MSYNGKQVVVTGADGFIGSHLAERLVEEGAAVTALSLYNSFDSYGWLDDLPPPVRAGLRLVRGDIRDGTFVRRLLEGAANSFSPGRAHRHPHSYAAPQSYVDTNITGMLNVLEAARACGTGRVVHTSTSEVYGTARVTPITEDHPLQAQSPYSATKISADMLATAYACSFDQPVAILRPFNTFGPRQSERAVIPTVIRQFLDPSCSVVRLGDLTTVRDFNYVSDTVEAFLALGSAGKPDFGQPYNAGSGTAVTIGEMVDIVRRLTGSDKRVEADPVRMRPDDSEVRLLLADSARLRAATGWQPRVSLEEGLKRTVAWWRARMAQGLVRRASGYMT